MYTLSRHTVRAAAGFAADERNGKADTTVAETPREEGAKMVRTLGAYAVVAAMAALVMALAACGDDGAVETPVEAAVEEVADRESAAVEAEPDRGVTESAADSAGPLVGVSWILKSLGPTASPDAVITGSRVSAVFSADGSLNGNGGCNSYSGSYHAEGGSISIGELGWTEMACADPDGVLAQETRFFDMLAAAETFAVEGDALTMRTEGGGILVFSRRTGP